MTGQLPLFAADTEPPEVADLDGLLSGPAQLVTRERLASLSVVVYDDWRAGLLLQAFAALDLGGEAGRTEDGQPSVRTDFTADLAPVARRWFPAARKQAPADLRLGAGQLRLWAIAAGRRDQHGYLLRLGPHDEPVWPAAGSALAGAGLAGVMLGVRAGGPAYRITGRRRLARLAGLIGEQPESAPDDAWPES